MSFFDKENRRTWSERAIPVLVAVAGYFGLQEGMGYWALLVATLPFLLTSRAFGFIRRYRRRSPADGPLLRDENWIESYLRASPILTPVRDVASLPLIPPEGTDFWRIEIWAESRVKPGRVYGTVTYGLPEDESTERGLFVMWEPGPKPRLDGVYEMGQAKVGAAWGVVTSILAYFILDRVFEQSVGSSHRMTEWISDFAVTEFNLVES